MAQETKTDLNKQAYLFATYLIGRRPSEAIAQRYTHIVRKLPEQLTTSDARLLRFIQDNPWSLPYVESYLAFFKADSAVRQRIYILFAVLEASPEYHASFLPIKRPPLYFLVACLYGVRAVIRLLIGVPVMFYARSR